MSEQLPIARVKVGERLRQDLGDVEALAESIRVYGLLHPIIVDGDGNLVAGHRRLEAHRILGKRMIEVRRYGDLTPEERREIELEENVRRKDLTPAERSRRIVETAKVVEDRLAADAERMRAIDAERAAAAAQEGFSPAAGGNPSPRPKGGRPRKAEAGEATQAATAEAAGVSRQSVGAAERHVALVKRFPFMESAVWSQRSCFAFEDALAGVSATDVRRLADLLRGLLFGDPKNAVAMAETLASLEPDRRERILRAVESTDERDRAAAIQMLARMNDGHEPDPRVLHLARIESEIRKQAKRFPGDAMNDDLAALADRVREVAHAMKRHHAARREEVLR